MSVKKKVRVGLIEPDPVQFGIVVNFTTEIYHLDDYGEITSDESVPGYRVVPVQRGFSREDIPTLAREITHKCKYISSSKVGKVEAVLAVLMESDTRQPAPSSKRRNQSPQKAQSVPPASHHHDEQDMPSPKGQTGRGFRSVRRSPLPDADLRLIDEYADKLYEEAMEEKVNGAKCILRVCTEARNLELLADHGTLLGMLSRELRDCSKKSYDFSIAVVCTFLCFSHFSQFHPILVRHHCGDVTTRVVEYESHRYQVRKDDIERRTQRLSDMSEPAKSEEKKALARDERKYKVQLNRQNKLMHICQMVLMNLAEEISIERKIVSRKMPQLLVQCLDRDYEDLLQTTSMFLKKLSIFEENKARIAVPEVLQRLVVLGSHQNTRVALVVLRVLYNLSFDKAVRAQMLECGILKVLLDQLRNQIVRPTVLKLLYHLSMDNRCKLEMSNFQGGMDLLLQLIINYPETLVGKDLVALMINISSHPRPAEVIAGCSAFPKTLLRLIRTRDQLLCKVIRNVISHEGSRRMSLEAAQATGGRIAKWLHELVRVALGCAENPDLLVEILGIFARLTDPCVPWAELCEAGMIDVLHRHMVVGFSDDDVLLECIMVVGVLALCKEAASQVAGSRLHSMLQPFLGEKASDDEISLQLLFTFQCLLLQEEVRDNVLADTGIAAQVLKLARFSKSTAVKEQALRCLEVIADGSVEEIGGSEGREQGLLGQIKALRFELHNMEWCDFINNSNDGDFTGDEYDSDAPQIQESEEDRPRPQFLSVSQALW